MGCWDVLAPMETNIAVPYIVSYDPQNIRSIRAIDLRDEENGDR
jgi:hypothetical protein